MSTRRVRLAILFLSFVFVATLIIVDRAPAAGTDQSDAPFAARWHAYASIPIKPNSVFFTDPVHDRLYLVIDGSHINVYDTNTAALVGNIPHIPQHHGTFTPDYAHLHFITYGSRYSGISTIHIYNTTTLTEIKTLTYQCSKPVEYCSIYGVAEAPDGRVFVHRPQFNIIDILDGETGEILDSMVLSSNIYAYTPIAIYGEILYAGGDSFEGLDNGVRLYDISNPDVTPAPITFYPIQDISPNEIRVSQDGSLITVIGSGGAIQFRASDFAFLWRINVTIETVNPNGDVLLSENHPSIEAQILSVLDAHTGEVVRSDIFDHYSWVQPIDEGGVAIGFYSEVELRRAVDNAIALPVVLNRACPNGVVIDDFNDPASGWPVGENERVRASYSAGFYEIDLLRDNLWVAFSRGDLWWNATRLQVLLNQEVDHEGTLGIVFGLNADWSDFYSFEVYPAEELWVLLHFHNGKWEIIMIDRIYTSMYSPILIGIRPKGGDLSAMDLTVNNQMVLSVPRINGLIGLSASSFDIPVTALFDSFRFTGENCGYQARNAPTNLSPVLPPHPSLDELTRAMP